MKELDEKIESLMYRGEHMIRHSGNGKNPVEMRSGYVCGKESSKNNIKHHIEGIHLDGISIPCNFCEKTSTSRYALAKHNSRFHRDSK